eukprot:TRINITY_DN776487_c0_g1_i1.p1 TRINITY_DN776487_c0_g1~~TRINITY_DN776487_c0_g1_i1.p1  ORF type:complete len:123 (-),score=22.18 TRINITY_DN776487_c0_g1_i1:81-449(-)
MSDKARTRSRKIPVTKETGNLDEIQDKGKLLTKLKKVEQSIVFSEDLFHELYPISNIFDDFKDVGDHPEAARRELVGKSPMPIDSRIGSLSSISSPLCQMTKDLVVGPSQKKKEEHEVDGTS